MSKYLVIKELHSATKVSRHLYIFDFMFVLIYLSISIPFRELVYDELQIPYFIFSGVVALKLVSRTRSNPGKHFYEAIFIWCKKESSLFTDVINQSLHVKTEDMVSELENKKNII